MNTPLRLAAVFGDHMVLCRNKPVRIFGEAADGARVTASLNGQTATVTARQGRFELAFAPMAAGGPYALTVTDGQTTLRFADVLLGDVYLAGGQSNMEMELKNTDDGTTTGGVGAGYNFEVGPVMLNAGAKALYVGPKKGDNGVAFPVGGGVDEAGRLATGVGRVMIWPQPAPKTANQARISASRGGEGRKRWVRMMSVADAGLYTAWAHRPTLC